MKNRKVGLDIVSFTEIMKVAVSSGDGHFVQKVEREMRGFKVDEGFVMQVG